MTLHIQATQLDKIDLNGLFDEDRDIRYLGVATLQPNGKYHVLAAVRGMLCWVEITITASEHEA